MKIKIFVCERDGSCTVRCFYIFISHPKYTGSRRVFFSLMTTQNINSYYQWLRENALWNETLVETKESPIGGLGVFWKDPKLLDDEIIDTILLRVPKSNILSTKNSLIYNLLLDYGDIQEETSEIDLTSGMHGLIICFIYELNMKLSSPWDLYLQSIDPKVTNIDLPVCLWSKKERELLKNTECAILGMDDLEELIMLFEACIEFAKFNSKLVEVPPVLDYDLSQKSDDFDNYKDHLEQFGKLVQSVISRAFQVDDYHGPSLVPGADLFNHLSPIIVDETQVIERENVHFVCDGGEEVCEICGEQDCDHMYDELDESVDEIDELDRSEDESDELDDLEAEHQSDEHDDESDEEEHMDVSMIEHSDIEIEDSDSSTDIEDLEDDDNSNDNDDEIDEDTEEIGEITMELIERLEQEERDNNEDSSDEGEITGFENSEINNDTFDGIENTLNDDLQTQLSDSSKCVDIILSSLPEQQYNYEIFNTYGNELSNPYLLQRYGFVCKKEEANINDTVLLFNEFNGYIKKLKSEATYNKKQQLTAKLTWLDENFDIICEVIHEFKKQQLEEAIQMSKNQHTHEEGGSDDDEDDEDDDDEDLEDFEDDEDFPDSWKLSSKVMFDGTVSIHTILIIRLIHMHFKIFKFKLYSCKQSKLAPRIFKYLLTESNKEEPINKVIRSLVQQKLNGYPRNFNTDTPRLLIINDLIFQEKAILQRHLES